MSVLEIARGHFFSGTLSTVNKIIVGFGYSAGAVMIGFGAYASIPEFYAIGGYMIAVSAVHNSAMKNKQGNLESKLPST